VLFDGQDLTAMQGDALRLMRQRVQLIFQDPIASLNPRRKIGEIVAEPLVISGVKDPARRKQLVDEVLGAVGLDPALVVGRLPHEFSGGQCQRICIARALVLNPEFIVCDEPVSALDVSIRAQILNLLEEMKARYGLTLLFIAHDLAVVRAVSDRVAVMYLGRLCEVGPSEQLFAKPAHPYTALLIEAIPVPDPDVRPTETVPVGEPPSPIAPPSGCRFRARPVCGLPSSADRRLGIRCLRIPIHRENAATSPRRSTPSGIEAALLRTAADTSARACARSESESDASEAEMFWVGSARKPTRARALSLPGWP
jgi:peptide/nickel transport system ATP-binding protein